MKRAIVALAILGSSLTARAELLITAVFDGPLSGGVPKGVELYATSEIPDLSIYGIGSANNGGGSDGEEFSFPDVAVPAGSFIYVASEETGFTSFFGFAPDYTTGAMAINGDDAIELFRGGAVVDLFGDPDTDGSGEPWEYQDGWAYRASGTASDGSFMLADWIFSGPNALDGESQNVSAASPVPLATFTDDGGTVGPTILINEVDADTAGTDTLEFIELYDGGVGDTALDGLSIVLFNGSNDSSYDAIDLDGFRTDAMGYFVVGSNAVEQADILLGESNTIQNGADAVALVEGDAEDYPDGTPVAVESGLVDALVYDTNDSDDAELLAALTPGQSQRNEDFAGNKDFDSNQRCPNGAGGALNSGSFLNFPASPGKPNTCLRPAPLTLISAVQGTPATQLSNRFGETDVSPLIGETVRIEGVVVGDFQDGDADTSRELRGFFVQEESGDEDGDPESSEGVFVFDPGTLTDVDLGDRVSVTGTVDQFFGETQIDSLTEVIVLDRNALSDVTPALITLPAAGVTISQNEDFQPDLEAFEGMLVEFVDELRITEQFQLDRFNEIKLVQGPRPQQYTQGNAPGAAGYEQFLKDLAARRITYDDGLNEQNANIAKLDGFAPYSEATAKRMGDKIVGLTGVLDYKWAGNGASGATWRVRSHVDGVNVFTSDFARNSPNPRPLEAPRVEGNLRIASFNVLNFFTTLDIGDATTANGSSPRGADSIEEFERQTAKLVNAIVAMDSDILGLVEIENDFDPVNDGSTAIEFLVNEVNATLGSRVYDYVYPGQRFVGDDAIAVGMIYKPSVVGIMKNSRPAVLDDVAAAELDIFGSRDFTADPIFDGEATNRAALAVSFKRKKTGAKFTLVVNHFKSKGQSGLEDSSSPNFDKGDGAGFWNQRRLDASVALLEWLDGKPTGVKNRQVIIAGDLNAYAMEDPVQYLLANGYNSVEDPGSYSFVFDGQIGTLDYILYSDSLEREFRGAATWHINADEADALDYNLDFGKAPTYFDSATPTRNSDHDPVLAGFRLRDNGEDDGRDDDHDEEKGKVSKKDDKD